MVFENALIGVLIISASTSLLISIIYKFTMDQDKIKGIKEKMNELQEKSKEARKKGDEEKAMEYTQKVMNHSKDQMKMQFKPMLITFVVIIPLFWFVLPGLYPSATVELNDSGILEYEGIEREVELVSEDPLEVMIEGETFRQDDTFKINNHRLRVEEYFEDERELEFLRISAKLPFSVPLVGSSLGWLGWYIVVSLGFSQVFRKLLGAR